MDIERLKKMSKAVYLACEEPVADDISDGIKWTIQRIEELEEINGEQTILLSAYKDRVRELVAALREISKPDILTPIGITGMFIRDIVNKVLEGK